MQYTIASRIAHHVSAIVNCQNSGNIQWEATHKEELAKLVKESLPSGSGFDNGTQIDRDASKADKLVFLTSFHHMNADGFYTGWTEHRVIVTPSFSGFYVKVTGPHQNEIKTYIADMFYDALAVTMEA
jgi:hypothetical protein